MQAGEAVEVTVRGRVIARIVPEEDRQAAAQKRLKALRGKARIIGDIIAPSGEIWDAELVVIDTHVPIHDVIEPSAFGARGERWVVRTVHWRSAMLTLWEMALLIARA